MNDEIEKVDGDLLFDVDGKVSRESIVRFEELLKEASGSYEGDSESCPLTHTFSDGIYVREIAIPEGNVIVGKIHKHEHPNFLMKGKVEVVTEYGTEIIEAPCSMISKSGTKRVLHSLTDLVWVTVHNNPTNTRDIEKLESEIIADSYDSYDKFISKKDSKMKKLKQYIIKKLSI